MHRRCRGGQRSESNYAFNYAATRFPLDAACLPLQGYGPIAWRESTSS